MGDTTTNRAYRIPASTDSVPTIADFWRNLGTDIDTDVQGIVDDNLTTVSDGSPGTVQTGFTLSADQLFTLIDGHLVDLLLRVVNTSAVTASGGDITDQTVYTLDSAYWPQSEIAISWTANSSSGGGKITSAGGVVLTTASDTIGASSVIAIHACYLVP